MIIKNGDDDIKKVILSWSGFEFYSKLIIIIKIKESSHKIAKPDLSLFKHIGHFSIGNPDLSIM